MTNEEIELIDYLMDLKIERFFNSPSGRSTWEIQNDIDNVREKLAQARTERGE